MEKVIFITDSGFWSHKQDVIKALNKQINLFVVVFITPGFGNHSLSDIQDFCRRNNVKLLPVRLIYRARSITNFIYFYKQIIKPTKKFNPDLIYAESFGSPFFLILLRTFFNPKKIVIGVHDYKLHEIEKNKTFKSARIYKYLYLKFFDQFHFFSYKQRNLFKEDYPRKKSYVVRLALVGADYERLNIEPSVHNSFLYFGRIQYYKGVDVLIQAINFLGRIRKDFIITIAGKAVDKEYYYSLLDNNLRDNVIFKLDYIKKEEIPVLFSNANYFIAPYREVTQSGPLMMAYNYGLIPVVSDDLGFIEYVENNRNGFVFENENPESLANILDKICSMQDDAFGEIKRGVKEFIEDEFDSKKIGIRYTNMFKYFLENE